MSDVIQKQWALASALVILLYWVSVFFAPFLVSDQQARAGAPLWFWGGLCSAIGYFSYTGLRAWRHGWKTRFILRIVVPAALLVIACMTVWLL
jgi:hypothetical protein